MSSIPACRRFTVKKIILKMIASVLTDTYISLGLKTSVDNSKDNDNKNFSQKDTRMTLGVCPRDPAYVL